MIQCGESFAAQALEKVLARQLRIYPYAIDLSADEKAHQLLGFAAIAARVRHADREVMLVAVAAQQQLPGAESHHKWRQSRLLAEPVQVSRQRRRQAEIVFACRMGVLFVAREVGRQVQRRQGVSEVVAPIVGAGCARCTVEVFATLPVGVVGVLNCGSPQR